MEYKWNIRDKLSEAMTVYTCYNIALMRKLQYCEAIIEYSVREFAGWDLGGEKRDRCNKGDN